MTSDVQAFPKRRLFALTTAWALSLALAIAPALAAQPTEDPP